MEQNKSQLNAVVMMNPKNYSREGSYTGYRFCPEQFGGVQSFQDALSRQCILFSPGLQQTKASIMLACQTLDPVRKQMSDFEGHAAGLGSRQAVHSRQRMENKLARAEEETFKDGFYKKLLITQGHREEEPPASGGTVQQL